MTVAYLTNQYPKVSHTFIRREIRALEALGHEVLRYSVRPTPDRLSDVEDLREQGVTTVILQRRPAELAAATSMVAARAPERFARAARLALAMGIRSERGPAVHGAYLAEACWLRQELTRHGVTHVHAHFGTNPATVAMLCHELGGPPWSFTVHGPEEFDKAPLIALSEKIRRASFVVAVSTFAKSQLYRLSKFEDWGKIHVVRCGVDEQFLEGPIVRMGAKGSESRLVCVGRLCEQKGQLLLVEAAAKLARAGERFQVVFVGDGEMRAEVESRVRAHGLENRISVTGWLDGCTVRREILQARAVVLPSFAEGLPVAIMEAFALGRPVVSTFIAGIPELVESGVSGWLVPAGSVDSLAGALREVLSAKPERIEAMGRAGRLQVQARHDVLQNARILSALFDGRDVAGPVSRPAGLAPRGPSEGAP